MKIAQVSPYDLAYPGGVTAHISHLDREFTRMGHTVKILAPCSGDTSWLADNVIPIGRPFPFPSGGSIARVTPSLMLSATVRAILKAEKFDIVHLHEPLTPMLPITVLEWSHSVNVGTFHAYHGQPRAYRIFRFILNRWFRRLEGVIAVSQPAMEFAARCFPGNYHIIPNGIDIAHFSPNVSPIEELCDGKLNILFVGRLEKRKGFLYLLDAYRDIKKQFPNSRLIAVGPGTRLRGGYERLIRESHLKDVVFTGWVPYEDLPRYYRSADVFCAPATGKESFGVILLEAMAVGTPIVASANEGYVNITSHGVEGLLVPPKDRDALVQAITSLLADKPLCHEMGARGRLKAEEYSWEHVGHRVMDHYLSLLEGQPGKTHPPRSPATSIAT
jgi:phosphatidylinositol alpha-mannosyltransferase